MEDRGGSPSAGHEHEANPIPLFEIYLSKAVAGHEPLVVHHHLHARIQPSLAVQEDPPRPGPEPPNDVIDQVGHARALYVDLGPLADRTGKGRKPDGLDDDFQYPSCTQRPARVRCGTRTPLCLRFHPQGTSEPMPGGVIACRRRR